MVVSDWFATRTAGPAARGGLDLVMPGPDGPWGDALVAAVRSGEVDEALIDEKVHAILHLADRAGLLGRQRTWREDVAAPDSPQRSEQLTALAAAGMVLLKNEGGVLPLAAGTRVAAIGRPVVATVATGGGSSTVNPPYLRSIAEGLTAHRSAFGDLVVVDGVEVRERGVPAEATFVTDPVTGEPGIRARYLDANGEVLEELHTDRTNVSVGFDDTYDRPAVGVELEAKIADGGALELGVIGVGAWTLDAGDHHEEFVLRTSGHDPGEAMLKPPSRSTLVEVADGTVVRAAVSLAGGGLSESSADNETLDQLNSTGAGPKGFVARPAPRPAEDVIADAVRAASEADVVVVGVGLTDEQEAEAVDKATLALPGEQDRLVREVAAAARRTVVVVNASTPVLMPWENDVDAVLVVGLPGQDGGTAVAKVLLGELEPSGRLVTTWPAADGATPAWSVAPDSSGDLHYTEGTFIGYRGHAPYGLAPAPAHWFGAGLGYGDVTYTNAEVIAGAEAPSVRVTVENAADRETREVVQVYFDPSESDEPVRLVGYAGVRVPAGGSADVTVTSDARLWRVWNGDSRSWGRLSGGGRLLVARGLGDVRAELPLD